MAKKILTAAMAFLSALSLLAGCGTDESKKSGSNAGSGDAVPVLDCDGNPALELGSGSGSGAAEPKVLRHVPADQLRLVSGNKIFTVCDLIRDKKATLAIFQFTSVACYECMKAIDEINTSLDQAGFGADLVRVAVVLDPVGSLTADNERRLKKDVAPNAVWMYDDFQDLWKFFAPGTPGGALPAAAPLALVMDTAARGYIIDATTFTGPAMVAVANTQLGLSLKGKPAAK